MDNYDLTVTMLSPVHVGTGEELTPDEYVIEKAGEEEYFFHALDLGRVLAEMSPDHRRKFDQAVNASSPTVVRRVVAEAADLRRHSRFQAAAPPGLYELYRRSLDASASPSRGHGGRGGSPQLVVHPMTRTGLDRRAYIPGSSIKGAVRTAVLQHLLDESPGRVEQLARTVGRPGQREAQRIEADILGNLSGSRPEIRADPFRAVRISDCPLPELATAMDPVDLVSLRSDRARRNDPSGIHLFYEMTFSALDGENITAAGTLSIASELAETPVRGAGRWNLPHCVSRAISAERILTACRAFYTARLKDEADRVARVRPDLAERAYRSLIEMVEQLGQNEAPIRLGRFSHVESVTLAPPLRRARGGTSRGLAGGELPMGWAKITLTPAGR